MEEMRIAIEDLEALRELNDELEETHVETERALHEELGPSSLPGCLVETADTQLAEQKETENREHLHKIEILQDALQEYEGTVQQFRELVINLQE